jgi:signal transduction histidine kinase
VPDQFQTLISNVLVLLAALIGFWGVIYSQRKLARMAVEQRKHEEQVAKDALLTERNHELASFMNAIQGELAALRLGITSSQKLLGAQISLADELARQGNGRKTQPRIAFRFATPVFDSHVARIGILSPEASFKISNLYGQIKAFAVNDQGQVPELDPAMASQVMGSVKSSLANLDHEIEVLQSQLVATSMVQTTSKN